VDDAASARPFRPPASRAGEGASEGADAVKPETQAGWPLHPMHQMKGESWTVSIRFRAGFGNP